MSSTNVNVTWLHISDFHFKSADEYQRDTVLNALLRSLPNLTARYGVPDLIFATGDIAHSGKLAEYLQASKFLDELLEITQLTRKELHLIAGNHDVDRLKGKGLSRTLTSVEEAESYYDPSEPLPHLAQRQAAFLSWYNEYFSGVHNLTPNMTAGDVRISVINGQKIAVSAFNSAVFSFDDNDHSKLWLGSRCIDAVETQLNLHPDAFRISLIHHPFDWLSPLEQAKVKTRIRSLSDVVLSGHLHENNAENIVVHDGASLHLTAGATYQTKKWPNTAMICTLREEGLTVHPIRFSDSPMEVWVTDPSIYPTSPDFSHTFSVGQKTQAASSHSGIGNAVLPVAIPTSKSEAAKADFEQDLFTSPLGVILYAEPRLMRMAQEGLLDENADGRVDIADIITSTASVVVEARAEYGATSLTKRICYELSLKNVNFVRRDARKLPRYKKKLEEEFRRDATEKDEAVLVLDNLVLEDDERLIHEIKATGLFTRVIALSVTRGLTPAFQPIDRLFGEDAVKFHLWPMARDDVRGLACCLFSTNDQVFISRVVDKVYADLLALCIPLTPPTVIMYLRVLNREGEFHPLNKVDILARYMDEMLRRPSDAYSESFNVKNKLDVVSAFVFSLYKRRESSFGEHYWHTYIHEYKEKTLGSFRSNDLLSELIAAKVFVRIGSNIFVRYSFFYDFFLGRFLSSRQGPLTEFLEAGDYLSLPSVIDVITGFRSDNEQIITLLSAQMDVLLDQFAERYLAQDFDPLLAAEWPEASDEEKMWNKVSAEIERGPRRIQEIDVLKTSLLAEARTADQQVKYQEFTKLERDVFVMGSVLAEALMNSDDVDGQLKLRAYDNVLRSHFVGFQIGCAFAPLLARNRYFRWGGIAFIDFHNARDESEDEAKTIANVIVSLGSAVSQLAGERLGSYKLSGVLRAREKSGTDQGLMLLMNFHSILVAKGEDWPILLEKIIMRTDKKAFYLQMMLSALRAHLRDEVIQSKDREAIKWLIATIRTKRDLNKQAPGTKLVKKVLGIMERKNGFSDKFAPDLELEKLKSD